MNLNSVSEWTALGKFQVPEVSNTQKVGLKGARTMMDEIEESSNNLKSRIQLTLFVSVVIGTVITLISRLIQTPMSHLGIDVMYWGIPLPWTIRVIPTHFQSIVWSNLIADLVFWVIIASVISTSVMYLGTRSNTSQPTSALST